MLNIQCLYSNTILFWCILFLPILYYLYYPFYHSWCSTCLPDPKSMTDKCHSLVFIFIRWWLHSILPIPFYHCDSFGKYILYSIQLFLPLNVNIFNSPLFILSVFYLPIPIPNLRCRYLTTTWWYRLQLNDKWYIILY